MTQNGMIPIVTAASPFLQNQEERRTRIARQGSQVQSGPATFQEALERAKAHGADRYSDRRQNPMELVTV